jgi:hypothetical protein
MGRASCATYDAPVPLGSNAPAPALYLQLVQNYRI